MALGAQTRDVVRLTLKQGMRPTLVGVALGLAGAFTLTRLMSSLLFGVSATDPETFVVSALFLLLIVRLQRFTMLPRNKPDREQGPDRD